MRRFFVLMLICIVVYACKPGIPKTVIPPAEMEKVLFDIHVVDGYINTIGKQDSAKLVASAYYKGVYQKFGIDSARYQQSMDYYYQHPDLMDKIYENVIKQFDVAKASNDKIVAAELTAQQNRHQKYLTIDSAVIKPTFKRVSNPFSLPY